MEEVDSFRKKILFVLFVIVIIIGILIVFILTALFIIIVLPFDLILAAIAFIIGLIKNEYPEFGRMPLVNIIGKPIIKIFEKILGET